MNTSTEIQNGSCADFIEIDLEPYTEGDAEFKRELATKLKENIVELKQALKTSIQDRCASAYRKACHKTSTSLFVVGGQTLIGMTEKISIAMADDRYSSGEVNEAVGRLENVLQKIMTELNIIAQS
jgi:type II secretory pathway component PulF